MNAYLAIVLSLGVLSAEDRPELLIVVGAAGSPEYGEMFSTWADQWQAAAEKGTAQCVRIGAEAAPEKPDRERLKEFLSTAGSSPNREPLWIVLIGHGTYDGKNAKFNLRGPDVTAAELGEWLTPIERPIAVINCASASGPFINALSAPNRSIVTATRSGAELNFARFGKYIAEVIADPTADLDKDEQVSLLEAFLVASNRTAEFYRTESRLATEHSLLDDNGDSLGTPPDWFTGVRATRRAKEGALTDGPRAHQFHLVRSERERQLSPEVRQKRDELERELAAVRDQKSKLPPDEYYPKLEGILVQIAELYQSQSTEKATPE